jgi:hypothetical protein
MSTPTSSSPEKSKPLDADLQGRRLSRSDLPIAAAIALASGLMIYAICLWLGNDLARLSIGGRWFNSDGWRVFDDMVDFDANHFRNRVRPWFSLIAMPPVFVFRRVLGASPIEAIWMTNAGCAALWSSILYATFRCLGCRQLTATACCALAIGSAGSLFWLTVPETYAISAIGLALGILVAAVATFRRVPVVAIVLAGAFAFGTVVTNWMVSLAYLAVYQRWGRAAIIAFASLVVAFGGWAVQKVIYPAPAALFGKDVAKERAYALHEDQGGPLRALHAATLTSVVAPKVEVGDSTKEATGGRLTVQRTSAIAGGPLGAAAAVGWLALLAAGLIALAWGGGDPKLRIFLAMLVCGQLGLHSVYGEETFLYSLHFVTVLVSIVAVAAAKWQRRGVVCAILAVAVLVGANNITRLRQAAASPFTGNDDRLQRLAE